MITGIVVGILVLWTLYAEVQDRQIRKLTLDTILRFTDRIEALEYTLSAFDDLEYDVKEVLQTVRGHKMRIEDIQREVDVMIEMHHKRLSEGGDVS